MLEKSAHLYAGNAEINAPEESRGGNDQADKEARDAYLQGA